MKSGIDKMSKAMLKPEDVMVRIQNPKKAIDFDEIARLTAEYNLMANMLFYPDTMISITFHPWDEEDGDE